MTDGIKVSVVEFGDRKHYQLQWRDPITGKKKTKSSGIERTGRQKELDAAHKAAGKLEDELRGGRYAHLVKATWEAFKDRYTLEVADHLADRTADKIASAFRMVEGLMQPPPKYLADLTTSRISEWVAKLLEEKQPNGRQRSPATVASHCRQLKAALRWAQDQGMIREVPKIRMPKAPKGEKIMRGRPITLEEHERIIAKVQAVLTTEPTEKQPEPVKPDPATVAQWKRFLTGLWWSGLRLQEALALSWDLSSPVAVVVQPGYRPAFRFLAEGQKSGRAELTPMAPEFARLLGETPEPDRHGHVFPLPHRSAPYVGRMVGEFGKAALVVVDEPTKKYASAHDYRRAFGTRWAKRVMPAVLKRLMRHASIETTMKYYVDQQADEIAEDLWRVVEASDSGKIGTGNSSSNTNKKAPEEAGASVDAN